MCSAVLGTYASSTQIVTFWKQGQLHRVTTVPARGMDVQELSSCTSIGCINNCPPDLDLNVSTSEEL